MKKHIFPVFAMITILLGIALGLYQIYLQFWPIQTLEVYDQPVKVLNSPVHPGEPITMNLHYCKFAALPAKLIRQLVGEFTNPSGYDVIPITDKSLTSNVPPICTTQKVSILIPMTVPEGTYHAQTTVQYDINPVRTINVVWITDKFQVIN